MKRTYTIPLRKAYVNKTVYKRTPTAVRAVKNFLKKHMKVEEVRLGKHLNMVIWARGVKNPPAKVTVEVEKKDDICYAELVGKEYYEPTKEDIEAMKAEAEKKAKDAKKKSEDKKAEASKEKKSEKTEEKKVEEMTEKESKPDVAEKKAVKKTPAKSPSKSEHQQSDKN